ncbi:MAG TPA: hypothetical protein VN047_01040 [Sphingopyxis sp.]|uniref:hypothetical protein n=1 Tax=Sphingopyxis sp. TaxID=1908224 RepID=UPI002C44D472|nr:hypothetical protein [Sphingopyxis sp.]HWW55456.1 hypothetical protein [Sphingopyxis sp.]
MDAGNRDALILPVPPEPFALVVGTAMRDGSGDALETSLRHMGLRPERVTDDDPDAAGWIGPPRFRLRFGTVSVLAGRAGDMARDLADPDQPSTSLLAASLPHGWQAGGQCWYFIPESRPEAKEAPGQAARMREFFKMMVLLIDMFDASHIFWSPARLWSDAQQFRASVAEMLASGMPPVLHLVAFRRRDTGDGASMATRGLALFAGQELEARIPGGWTVAEMVRRLSRLALDMMLNGPVLANRTMRGLGAGEWIGLSPRPIGGNQRSTVVVEFGRDT